LSHPSLERGELAIVLHSHMPYVEGFGTWPFGEEWLFEATATSYLPLIELLQRWAAEGRRQVVTVGVTPVLGDQLALAEVGERFLSFLRGVRVEAHRLDTAALESAGQVDAAAALRRSARNYEHATECFERIGGDVIGELRRLSSAGAVELWTSAATHALLPLLATEVGVRLQLRTGIDAHRQRFGSWSGGFWLPECAYRPGLEDELTAAGVQAFCVDQTEHGDELEQLEPIATVGGPIAVPIDWRTISLVWDDRGYPADPVYRDYHAQTMNGLRPYANDGGAYDADAATARARAHARDFVAQVVGRLDRFLAARGRPGLVVCALDTELLGHWWHEGPTWLAAVVEEADAAGLALGTIPDALGRHSAREASLGESSWGSPKDFTTWDSGKVAEFAWSARAAELALVGTLSQSVRDAADQRSGSSPAAAPAAARAARELLAIQSSDWAFMATRALAGDYPDRRLHGHVAAFEEALADLDRSTMKDSRPMSDPNLRGLAPALQPSTLLEPSVARGPDTV
jgi:1,4-alpha-glucan branching enzyme